MAQPTGGRGQVVTDQRVSGAAVAIAWVVAIVTIGYMLPWAVAATRGKSNQAAIALINLFLGWSGVGWIAALVMACQAHQVAGIGGNTTVVVAQTFRSEPPGGPFPPASTVPAGWYPAPGGAGQRYWDGAAWTEHLAP